MTNVISAQTSLTLDLPPSCVEFCPTYPDYFVVGTYHLERTEPDADQESAGRSQVRHGSLIVFYLAADNHVEHVQTLQHQSGVLDLHFHPKHTDVLAVVNSTGMLSVLRLMPPTKDFVGGLTEIAVNQPLTSEDNAVFTSCSWHKQLDDIIAITTSTREVHLFTLDEDWRIAKTEDSLVHRHGQEAWTVTFAPSRQSPDLINEVTVLSGGDDSKLLSSRCEYPLSSSGIETGGIPEEIKGHTAGVTAILPILFAQGTSHYILATGSYDNYLRIYDMHTTPRLLNGIDLGGGVWRLKLIDMTKTEEMNWHFRLFVCCTHGQTKVVSVSGGTNDCQIEVLASFEKHQSMNYGSDFQPNSSRCVSTSFYDKLLCIWDFEK